GVERLDHRRSLTASAPPRITDRSRGSHGFGSRRHPGSRRGKGAHPDSVGGAGPRDTGFEPVAFASGQCPLAEGADLTVTREARAVTERRTSATTRCVARSAGRGGRRTAVSDPRQSAGFAPGSVPAGADGALVQATGPFARRPGLFLLGSVVRRRLGRVSPPIEMSAPTAFAWEDVRDAGTPPRRA